jgi:fatty-acyl-CoA synthase
MVTGVPATEEYEAFDIDRAALEEEGVVRPATGGKVTTIVGCGIPVRETALEIVDDDDQPLEDGHVGEISIKGSSVMREYFNDPEATAETLRGGWLRTGDLGYLSDGKLYVTGRKKELIIISGRNYYPQDIERTVQLLKVVRPGSVVAFGTQSGRDEGIVVVAAPGNPQDSDNIAKAVRSTISETLNLPVLDVVLLESGRIPRTTSGKLCRGRCRDLYEEGKLA